MKRLFLITCQRMQAALVVGVALLLIAGCAQPKSWSKPGLREADFDNDMQTCRRQATLDTQSVQFGDTGGLERVDMRDRLINRCMEAKGYRQTP